MSDPFYGGLPGDGDEVAGGFYGRVEGASARTAGPGEHIEPVELEVVRRCAFKAKGCGMCGKPQSNVVHKGAGSHKFRRRNGCARCGKPKGDRDHMGAPKSFNVLASGQGSGNAMVYASMKASWQEVFEDLLRRSGLPLGLRHVLAEGEITFPDRREDRDQGNFRVVIEKALGDALQAGGWLARDDWTHYEFGGLAQRYVAGESATRIMLFASAPAAAGEASGGSGQGALL